MKTFSLYLKQHRKSIAAFAVFSAVFGLTFWFCRLPLKAVFYPVLLCAVLGGVFFAADYRAALKKHRRLERMCSLPAAMISDLSGAESIFEADYMNIINNLKRESAEAETAARARYCDTVEYYTMWAHQIKTPIASMRLTLQGEDTPLSRQLSSDLFRIEQYVEMVMTFLRLDSDSSDYVFREYSVDDIIRSAVRKFAPEFITKKIKLCYEPVLCTVVTDDKWLSFVIEQVLSNALKYTESGSISIYMAESKESGGEASGENSGNKTLCIEDTGAGIAPEDLPRIFEKGYTGLNGRYDKRASGIGLYLCRRICGKLGSAIEASSEVGKGTVIRINLSQYKPEKE